MRKLLLFLLLVNAVFFYWQTQWLESGDVMQSLQPEVLPPGVEHLTLLHERASLETVPAETAEFALEPLQVATGSEEEIITAQTDVEPALDQGALEIVAAAQDVPGENQTAGEESAGTEEVVEIPPVVAVPSPVPPLCFSLGPFVEVSIAQTAKQRLTSAGAEVEQLEEVQRSLQGYWVYLPAAKDYSAARETAGKLKEKGIKDLYIMGKGSYQNAISLGLFRQKDASQIRLKQMQKLGFPAVLDEQYREKILHHLTLTLPGDQPDTLKGVKDLAGKYTNARLEEKACEELRKPE